jgi:hypothetical protein
MPAPAQDAAKPTFSEEQKSELIYRVSLGRADDVKLLLDQGGSANQANPDGTPILSLASARTDQEGMEVTKLLLEAGADINAKDSLGRNALFYAVRSSSAERVMFLLEHGIDYYATDNQGDIARTIAFRTGHKDLVTVMDDFVKGQTAEMQKKYDEFNKAAEERNRLILEQEKSQTEAQKQEELAKANAQAAQPTPEELAAAKAQEQKKKLESPEFTATLNELVFHNCAYQYWSFCFSNKQRTELTNDELDLAIDSHKEHILSIGKTLTDAYGLQADYIEKLSGIAKQLAYDELAQMPSNSYRREKGVGHMDDMMQRCKTISKRWGEMHVKAPEAPTGGGDAPKKKRRSNRNP